MNKPHILYEYDKYVKKYKNIYGQNTIVLIQLGSFFEICADLNDNTGETDIHHICDDILSIAVGKKSIKSDTNTEYLMAGFPMISQEKHISNLLKNDYTVVLVEQTTEPPNPEREVTQILSPGTSITHNNDYNNYLMSIFIISYNYKGDSILKSAISTIDLSTGNSNIHMIENTENDNNHIIDEIGRYINFYNPKECIFHTENYMLSEDDILKKWDLNTKCFRINHLKDPLYKKPSYQRDILTKIYNKKDMSDIFESLHLTNDELRLSFMYMIFYIIEHKRNIVNNIENPKYNNDSKILNLTNNSIRQLNVVNNYSYFKGKNESLLSIVDICNTSMGKRLLKNRLLYPSTDKSILQTRYNNIKYYLNDDFYKIIRNDLMQINDLDKSLRLMGLNMIQPYNFYSTYLSYNFVEKCLDKIDNFNDNDKSYILKFKTFMKEVNETFDFKNIKNIPIETIDRSIFMKHNFENIDDIDNDILEYDTHIQSIIHRLSKFIDDKNDVIKCTDGKDGEWQLYTTKRRAQTFKQRLSNLHDTNIHIKNENNTLYTFKKDDFTIKSKDSNSSFILCDTISKISKTKSDLQKRLSKFNIQYYDETISYLYDSYKDILKYIHNLIADIDFYTAGAKLSIDNNYYKPIINNGNDSMINAVEMRHPIVERINEDTKSDLEFLPHLNFEGSGYTNRSFKGYMMAGSLEDVEKWDYKPQVATEIKEPYVLGTPNNTVDGTSNPVFRNENNFAIIPFTAMAIILGHPSNTFFTLPQENIEPTIGRQVTTVVLSGDPSVSNPNVLAGTFPKFDMFFQFHGDISHQGINNVNQSFVENFIDLSIKPF